MDYGRLNYNINNPFWECSRSYFNWTSPLIDNHVDIHHVQSLWTHNRKWSVVNFQQKLLKGRGTLIAIIYFAVVVEIAIVLSFSDRVPEKINRHNHHNYVHSDLRSLWSKFDPLSSYLFLTCFTTYLKN